MKSNTPSLLVSFALALLLFACQQNPITEAVDSAPSPSSESPAAVSPKQASSKYLPKAELVAYPDQAPIIQLGKDFREPFDEIEFDRVIAYDYNDTMRPFRSIWDAERAAFAPTILQQKALSEAEVQTVIELLTSPKTYGEGTAACFDPRLAIIFYQGQEKTLVVDICLDCNYLQSSVAIPAQTRYVKDLGDGLSYPLKGFSRSAQKQIIELGKVLDFYYGSVDPERLNTF